MTRRAGTIPKKIRLTDEGLAAIKQWADDNNASFSAAIESLARLGLGQAPAEALAPMLVSVVRREIRTGYDRLVSLTAYGIIEAGTARRLAGAGLYQQRPEGMDGAKWKDRYTRTRDQAETETRREFSRSRPARLVKEMLGETVQADPDDQED